MTLRATWYDRGVEPRNPPDPRYPMGIDLDASDGAAVACQVGLPYPAKRIGCYIVTCDACGQTAVITTAGRPDDPRSVKLRCQPKPEKVQ